MGLFSKKVDYDELYRKLSSEKMTPEEARKAEKELKKLAKSGDKRGVIWRPLTSVQIQSVGSVNWATSEFEEAEHKYGICEEYVRVRSLPIVFNLFNESYEKYNDPKGAVFVARAYEHGWGVEKNHGKAVEIIRETENYPKDGTFRLNSDIIKNAYKEIAGAEFPDYESSKQKEKQAISDAAKNQNEQPQSDINFKRLELDGGDVYEGYFLNEKKNGHGKYIWANGDVFDGNWVDGKRTGKGKVTWSNGASFDGEWKDDQMSEGKYTFPDGEIYDGSFQNGKKEGYGKQVFPDGEKYEGQWHVGKKHGHGTYTWADGDTYEGEWQDGKRCGGGKLIQYGKSPTGEIYMKYSYDGEWLDSKEHGHGICVEGDFGMEEMDKVLEGGWVSGIRQGRFIWYLTFSNGGRYINFYEDGKWIEGGIPYDESIKTVEDARRAKALADEKSRSSAAVRTTTAPTAVSSNLSADGVLSRDNPALKMLLDFVTENPAIFSADYDNENLNCAINALKKGDGLRYLFYVKRSKAFWMLKHNCVLFYTMLLNIYRNYDEEIYNNLVRRLVYRDSLAELSYEDAEYCLYLFDAFIPHGRDYEAMARCCYRLGDVKSAARWVAEGCPLYDEIMAFRHLQKAQNVWERGRYAFNEDS